MREISPGLLHWTARHDRIGQDVSSYYLVPERVAIDPLLPPEGLEAFEKVGRPEHVLLTNRHHGRDAWKLVEAFGATVHCVRVGLHEVEGRGPVTPFDFGDELPGGIVAHEVGWICPDETALHVPAHRALAVADGVIAYGGLRFVPDDYLDDPEQTKQGLRDAYRRLAELEFDTLLTAHGEPLVGDGRQALKRFVEAG